MFSYLYNGIEHTDTSGDYCRQLGMNGEQIRRLQQDAATHNEDYWALIRIERDRRMRAVEWRLHRMYREEMLGMPRSDSEDVILDVHRYMQQLADVPQQSATPDDVEWPVLDI